MDFHPQILNNNSHLHEPLRMLCCEVLQTLIRNSKNISLFPSFKFFYVYVL